MPELYFASSAGFCLKDSMSTGEDRKTIRLGLLGSDRILARDTLKLSWQVDAGVAAIDRLVRGDRAGVAAATPGISFL